MLQFEIDENRCSKCGLCANDCPVRVINLKTGYSGISPEKESSCMQCQHCLAVCPHGALSILGKNPDASDLLAQNSLSPDNMEILIKGRRSVRQYKDENLDGELIERLLNVAWYSPTGVNMNGVHFTVIDNKEKLNEFRKETYKRLEALIEAGKLPADYSMFVRFVQLWNEKGIDILFRNAPHLVVSSSPQKYHTSGTDNVIALAYFELFAQSLGVGTLWNGMLEGAIDVLAPELKLSLGIPEKHKFGYVMIFGKPAVEYKRTIQKDPANIAIFDS